ncbi:MAG: T9SS type A sorting domain-containing protein, partial [Bacteroidota bacterium]
LLATNHSLYLVLGDQHLYSDNVKLLCIHSSGTVLWEKSLLPQFQRIRSAALLPSSSGGFWFGSAIYDAEDTHQSRACFVRLDSLGNQVWIKELEPEERGEEWLAPKLWECSNGDIVGLSTIDNFDDAFHHQAPPVVQRISPQGEILWKHVFYDWDEQLIYQIREAKNGDLVGVGFSGISEAEGFPPKPIGGGGWIFRFNPEGDLLWERKIVDTLLSPYKGMAFADYIEQADGSFVLTGAIFQEYDSDLLTGVDLNILFMTLSANGCFSPNCKDVTQLITQVKILPNTDPDIEVYPTVFSNYLYLDIPEAIFSRRGQVYLELFDLKGHLVFSNKLTASGIQNAFSLPQLAQGMYLLHLKQGNTSLYRNKIIRQ